MSVLLAQAGGDGSGGGAVVAVVVLLVVLLIVIKSILIVVREYERAVIFRFGRVRPARRGRESSPASPPSTGSRR